MYKNILVCLDNSDHSTAGIDAALAIASSTGAKVTGIHVYAASLHNARFSQMEDGLPPEYRDPKELERQRAVHSSLITKGLEIISDSYTAVLAAKALSLGIKAASVHREGKNYSEILKEAENGGYDLVIMGAFGLGRSSAARVGSVAERVARRLKGSDLLIIKEPVFPDGGGSFIAAVDGSPSSFGGLVGALDASKVFGRPVEAVSAFDPDFHYTAFRSIAGVLSEEGGRVFRFKEQERLHNEIIDKGLARIYRGHLDTAETVAKGLGCEISTTLLSGKASDKIIKHVKKTRASLLALGRTGVHADDGLDIGSVTENCLREAPCNILISGSEFTPAGTKNASNAGPEWSMDASRLLEKIPPFARGIARNMLEDAAKRDGVAEITVSFMRGVREKMKL